LIPYGKQDINQADIDSVVNVLKSDFLTQGPQVPLFEKALSDYCNAAFGVAVNSATSALHIACLALDLKEGDWLWTSPNSFVASANCGLYCGARLDFVDINPKTYNVSTSKLEKKLIKAKEQNKLPKVFIPVHFAGQSCNMKKIHLLGKKYGFKIIEDASHAIGGKYLGKPIGGCEYSEITVFSFHPVKIITTAEGGVATTNSKQLAEKMQLLRSHGITRENSKLTKDPDGDWYYQQVSLGFNYRMTEIQAALGISQMKRLDKFVAKRHDIHHRYDLALADLPIICPYQDPACYSSLHLYPIQINLNKTNKKRKEVFCELRERGIGVNVHYIPIHLQPHYQKLGFQVGDYHNAETYYNNAISLPIYSSMTISKQQKVLAILRKILE
jgi:UDP-4-amino-4,6-dideoxy-N-acetyl-beta-L-altrosamine transaminase